MRKALIVFALAFILIFPAIARADLNDGLVAYYPFDGDAKDYSGNGNDGTEYGNVVYETGVIGLGVKFDGKYSQYVEINRYPFSNLINDLSISVWIISNGDSSNYRAIVSNEEKKGDPIVNWPLRLMLWKESGTATFDFTINNRLYSASISSSKSLHDKKPHFIVVVRKNNNLILYIDGKRVKSTTFSGNIDKSNAPLYIGLSPFQGQSKYGSYPFKGIIDELRIYNRALSESEIKELYEQGLNNCSSSGYTETDLQKKYSEGFEAGKEYCKKNPSACGISVSSSTDCSLEYQNGYNKGYEDGKNTCGGSSTNPFIPGDSTSECYSTYNVFTNTLKIPCFSMENKMYDIEMTLESTKPIRFILKDVKEKGK